MKAPLDRVDASLFAALGTAAGLDNAARHAADGLSPLMASALRFVDLPVATFEWAGRAVFLTPTDATAMIAFAILCVRFVAWALAPVAAVLARRRGR